MRTCLLILPIMLAACGAPPGDRLPPAKSDGRVETQTIRNTDAIGYDGSGIANKLDAALDAHDRRQDELDARLDAME